MTTTSGPQTSQEPKKRSELPQEFTWDLSRIFSTDNAWEKELKKVQTLEKEILKFQGKLQDSSKTLAELIQKEDELGRFIDKLYVYAHLRSDEDKTSAAAQSLLGKIQSIATQVRAALSWIEPEILSIPDKKMQTFLASKELKPYLRALEVLLRQKAHTLSPEEERILSLTSEPLSFAYKTFSMLNDADLQFPQVTDPQGQTVRLTQSNYIRFLESSNRKVRQQAFESLYSSYHQHRNTFASILESQIKAHVLNTRVRKFKSCLDAALFPDHISKTVYENLIETVHKGLPHFHRYLQLRRRFLKLDQLHMYDLHVPMLTQYEKKVPYSQAQEWVKDSTQALGDDYVKILQTALDDRWIDVLECKGKRSGAYSSGSYDTDPYILLNYQDNLNSAFTLAHELGHSMHSYLSKKNQPHIYSNYRIFVAEVASTTNEALLLDYLIKKDKDPRFQAYLLNHSCDEFRSVVFRQTMFSEFEKTVHELSEQGTPLTADLLCEKYYNLNKQYYGPETEIDRAVEMEWARIPHFYYNFYVYKYATGFSAAQVFSKRILSGNPSYIQAYLTFLKSGSTQDPLDLLKTAGVDLSQPDPIESALKQFKETLDKLEACLTELWPKE